MSTWRQHVATDGQHFWASYGPAGGIERVLPATAQWWIPIDKGLPDEDTECIVSLGDFTDADTWLEADGELVSVTGWVDYSNMVQAWQPRPGVYRP